MPFSDHFLTDADLVTGLVERNERAFSLLYDTYNQALYGVILRIVHHEETAQDLLQDTFVKVYRNIGRYDATKGRLFTWLLHITRNTAIDYQRTQRAIPARMLRLDEPETAGFVGSLRAVSESPAYQFDVGNLLDRLKPVKAELIALRYFQGYTDEDIAKERNIPLGTVKGRIRTGLLELRNFVDPYAYDAF